MTVSVFLDGAMILLLAGTIFYAARLSVHIRSFRDNRRELETLIENLVAHIEKAGEAVEGLREGARQSGRDLQALINEARGLSEELQIMSESGNSLASRLEKLADKSARSLGTKKPASVSPRPFRSEPPPEDPPAPFSGFSIRDPEFEKGEDDGDMPDDDSVLGGETDDNEVPATLTSRAERELYEALRRRKTEVGGLS